MSHIAAYIFAAAMFTIAAICVYLLIALRGWLGRRHYRAAMRVVYWKW